MATSVPLLSSLELKSNDTVNTSITRADVKQNHQMLIENEISINSNMDTIITILGGSDFVLQHFLSIENQSSLTTTQLHQINNILSLLPIKHNMENVTVTPDPILSVSSEHTPLHRCCMKHTVSKLWNILYGKVLSTFFTLFLISHLVIYFYAVINNHYDFSPIWDIYYSFFVLLIGTYLSLTLLSLNTVIVKEILMTFEFWFKLLYFLRYWICVIISYKGFTLVNGYYFCMVLGLIVFCLLDGLQVPFRVKASVLVIASLYATSIAINWTFFLPSAPYIYTLHLDKTHSFEIDIVSFGASSMRIVAIFMWKQTIYSMFRAPKSTLIKIPVEIRWI